MSVKVLHFADAHIDIASGGKRDSQTGLSYRTLDFLSALDSIIDQAIAERVDLVLFAGDAYRDSVPGPIFQREWGKRMMRLSMEKIPTLMIAGNHDSSNSSGKASALQEYDTLQVPYLHLARNIGVWTPEMLDGVQAQVLAVPWIPRSRIIAQIQSLGNSVDDLNTEIGDQISDEIERSLDEADPDLPLILLAHYSVVGAVMQNQQMVSLGTEVTLSDKLVKDSRISYTALGHIHKYQDLNPGKQPPVIYPGSIERVNFGEIAEDKGFVLASVSKNHTDYRFQKLTGRKYFSKEIILIDQDNFGRLSAAEKKGQQYIVAEPDKIQQIVLDQLPEPTEIADSMVRLTVHYPREWESFLDEREIRKAASGALEFHLVFKPVSSPRIRLGEDTAINSITHLELLERYCESVNYDPKTLPELLGVAKEIIDSVSTEGADL